MHASENMSATTRVELHCHSIYSDGSLPPGALVEQLAADGVAHASLTDHDTLEGLQAFRNAASRNGIGFITGVEITTLCNGQEAHLLAYGFDPEHRQLLRLLDAVRVSKPPTSENLAGAIRHRSSMPPDDGETPRNGRVQIEEAIETVHAAGGRTFLAHPFTLESDPDRLDPLLGELKSQGLDGVEAIYGRYSESEQQQLRSLAQQHDLLVSGGSDVHDRGGAGRSPLGVDMPTELWKRFRDATGRGRRSLDEASHDQPRHRMKRRHFLLHVLVPTVLAMSLFVGAIFAVFLPAFERSLLDRKRETIRELTQSAWSILAAYERDVQSGLLNPVEAREMAARRIEDLRYGSEGKDYFWIQDLQPRIIMHPYRPELNGTDVSDYVDQRGVRIFVKFAEVARESGGGYVNYVWQWKDDPRRFAPKESYVKIFEPWGWVIGTGLYTEDVQAEIESLETNLLRTSVGIAVLVALLLLYVLRQSLRVERARSQAEEGLRESTARYRSLVEATSEGTLLVQDGRCRYGNAILLEAADCRQEELQLLDLDDLLPRRAENAEVWAEIERVEAGEPASGGIEGVLRRSDDTLVECIFAISAMSLAGIRGLILLVTPLGRAAGRSGAAEASSGIAHQALGEIAEAAPIGLLRARPTSQGTVLRYNRAAEPLLAAVQEAAPGGVMTLPPLFPDQAAWEEFLQETRRDGKAERTLRLPIGDPRSLSVRIEAVVTRDERDEPRYLDCSIEDVTATARQQARREALIERLQASMLFLHEPVAHLASEPVLADPDEPVREVVSRITAAEASAAVVTSPSGEPIGIFTDQDLRERIVAAGTDLQTPIGRVMTAPVKSIPENAEIYEALAAMERDSIQHLALEDRSGRVSGVVHHSELLQFPNYGPIVLARDIDRSDTVERVVSAALRAPTLAASLIESGAQPAQVTSMLTSVCDAATVRFIELARRELGPPPRPFVFLALGSHGREEMVLTSDQDNALVYADGAGDDAAVQEYFLDLGRRVCGWLDDAGYPYCRGEIMAQNPKWCRPLSVWKRYFEEWIRAAEPNDLLEFVAFFDFRPVSREQDDSAGRALADELREHVFTDAAGHPAFFSHLAQQALQFKPPVRLFGRIIAGGTAGEDARMVNLKDAQAPLTAFARLYALRERIEQTNTLDRLEALAGSAVLSDTSAEQTISAQESFTRLRLQQQAVALSAGREADNLVAYHRLGPVDQAMLNQSFAQVAAVQKRVSYDFLGGT